jgi:formylmethanofuran dehydrogenase subunit E
MTTASKAWIYCYQDGDMYQYLRADTRGKARVRAAAELDCSFIEARIRRMPKWDNLTGEPTARDWLEAGYFVECSRCSDDAFPDEAEYDAEGEPLCEHCAEEYPDAVATTQREAADRFEAVING